MERFIRDIKDQTIYVPRALVLTLIVLPAYLFITGINKKQIIQLLKVNLKKIWLILFCFSLAFILMSTILGRWPRNPYKHIFDYFGFIRNGVLNMEFFENVFMFIPYSFFFLQAHRIDKPWKSVFVLSSVTTCCIEVLQLLLWTGSFQFSDILHNIEGGMIGCGLWYLTHMLRTRVVMAGKWKKMENRDEMKFSEERNSHSGISGT